MDKACFLQLVNHIDTAPELIETCHELYTWSSELFKSHKHLIFDGELTLHKIKLFHGLNLHVSLEKVLQKNPACFEALEFGYEIYVFQLAEKGSAQQARMSNIARAITENCHLTNKLIELKQLRAYLRETLSSPSPLYTFESHAFIQDYLNLVASAKVKPGKNTCLYGSWFTFCQTPTLEQRMEMIRKVHGVTIEKIV